MAPVFVAAVVGNNAGQMHTEEEEKKEQMLMMSRCWMKKSARKGEAALEMLVAQVECATGANLAEGAANTA